MLKILKRVLLVAFFASMALISCEKDEAQLIEVVKPNEDANGKTIKVLERPKLLYSTEFGSYYAPGSTINEGIEVQSATDNKKKSDLGKTSNIVDTDLGFPLTSFIKRFDATYSRFYNGTQVVSTGRYYLIFQGDGNLVLYLKPAAGSNQGDTPLWATNKQAPWPLPGPIHPLGNSYVEFTQAGDVYCHSPSRNFSYWGAGISNIQNPIWVLQFDGNFVGYSNYYHDYILNADVITGSPFASTNTQGGQVSNRSGRLR